MTKLPNLKPGDVVIRRFPDGRKQLSQVRAVNDRIVYVKSGIYTILFDASTGDGITPYGKGQRTAHHRIYVDHDEIAALQKARTSTAIHSP
jgi:hypothetical protein